MKVAINKCYGGFDLSNAAIKRLLELKGKECYFYKQTKYSYKDGMDQYKLVENPEEELSVSVSIKNLGNLVQSIPDEFYYYYGGIDRTDSDLIKVIEELQGEASGRFGNIKVVDIPDGIVWEIDDYDGVETIHECHRSW